MHFVAMTSGIRSKPGPDGRFDFGALPAGTYDIRITCSGYEPKVTQIFAGIQDEEFFLEEQGTAASSPNAGPWAAAEVALPERGRDDPFNQ